MTSTPWGSPKEIETRRRIKLSIWAYAYEFENVSLVPDALFDIHCGLVDLNIRTDRPDLDLWFVMHFKPHTGMWIRSHPELDKIRSIYERYYK